MAAALRVLASSLLIMACALLPNVHSFEPKPWKNAHATNYGASDGLDNDLGGACGFQNLKQEGYDVWTTALSSELFKDGAACGSCYEIKCASDDPTVCKPNTGSIVVTGTNLCPPNWDLPSDNGGWCNPPREHFDLSRPAYLEIAEYEAGIVPIEYRRVPCKKQGGIHFTITGNPYFNLVTVTNVGGAGDITDLEVKGDENVGWVKLKRNWGEKWETNAKLVGQTLSFRFTTSDGRTLTSHQVAPETWEFGKTYECKNNY